MPAERFYIDSNVLISLLREEMNGNFRLLFKEADAFFNYAKKTGSVIVVSELFFSEVEDKIYLNKEAVLEQLLSLGAIVESAGGFSEDYKLQTKKFEMKGIHRLDAKHLAIAIWAKCDAIVTFNKKDFEK